LNAALRFGLWADLLAPARAIGLSSGAERQLIRSFIRVSPAFDEIVGVGIDTSPRQSYPRHQQDPADAPERDETDTAESEPAEEVD